jgi:hypothetical protein
MDPPLLQAAGIGAADVVAVLLQHQPPTEWLHIGLDGDTALLRCILASGKTTDEQSVLATAEVLLQGLPPHTARRYVEMPNLKVRKNAIFAPFLYKSHLFTKTGSGQTEGKLKKEWRFLIGRHAALCGHPSRPGASGLATAGCWRGPHATRQRGPELPAPCGHG